MHYIERHFNHRAHVERKKQERKKAAHHASQWHKYGDVFDRAVNIACMFVFGKLSFVPLPLYCG